MKQNGPSSKATAEMIKQYPEPARPIRAASTEPHIAQLSVPQELAHFPMVRKVMAGMNIATPPPPTPMKYHTYVVKWLSFTKSICPSGKKSNTLATMQQVASGMRAKPRERANPKEHIFLRGTERSREARRTEARKEVDKGRSSQ